MKVLLNMLSIGATLCVSAAAFAENLSLDAGQTVYHSSPGYVTCNPPVPGPPPGPPSPPPPPPTYHERVMVRAAVGCLQAIPRVDGKSLMNAAIRCDQNNPERRILSSYTHCTPIRANADSRLAESIIAKATTIIYEWQKNNIREACTSTLYDCERPGY